MAGKKKAKPVPQIVIKSIGLGILLMALFTFVWLGIASAALQGVSYAICIAVLVLVVLFFIGYAIRIFKQAKKFPKKLNKKEQAREERVRKGFMIIFGLEGFFIGSTCGVLYLVDLPQFIIPSIALIVGLHFYPMAGLFERAFDYLAATWTTVIAIITILLMLVKVISERQSFLLVGVGTAIATIGYGIYMITEAGRHKRKL